MAKLWPFENVGSRTLMYVCDVTLSTTESSSKSKLIWPINYLISENAKTGLIKKVYYYMTGLAS